MANLSAHEEHDWAANQEVSWYRSPVPIAKLRELSRRNNPRALLQSLGHLAMVATTGTAVFLSYQHLSWPWLIVALFLHGTVHRTMQHARHELSHRTVFRSRRLNEIFLRIFNFLIWASPEYFRASHLRHHQYTTHDELDREVLLPRPLLPLQWITRMVVAVPNMLVEIGTIMRWSLGRLADGKAGGTGSPTWEQRCFADSPTGSGDAKKRTALFAWARVVLLGHLALAVSFVILDLEILLVVVTFARWLAPWLSFLLIETQHAGLSPNTPDFRRCCRTMLLGPVVRFLYWHMNYHIEHHMFPSVPFYNLAKLRRAIASDLPTAPRGLIRAWGQMLPVLWRQRKDPSYVFVP